MELDQDFYSATQVARMLKVKPHVLRYWETEFEITPQRNSAGRRIYSKEQVEKLSRIGFLRYKEKLTVKGTKRKLDSLGHINRGNRLDDEQKQILLWLKKELTDLRETLLE